MRNLNEGKKKAPTYMAELSEIDKQSAITAMEAKINKLAEMAEAKTQRLNLVSEDENLSELIDKKAMNEMRRNIKEIEKAKLKLEKLYEKACGSKPKEMVDEDASEDSSLDDAVVGVTDEKEDVEEGYSKSSYEEDDLKENDRYRNHYDEYANNISREYEYDEDEDETMNENVYGSIGFIPRDKDSKPEHPRFREMSAEEIQDYIDANPRTLWGSSLSMAKMVRDEKLGMDPMNEEFNRFRKLAGL